MKFTRLGQCHVIKRIHYDYVNKRCINTRTCITTPKYIIKITIRVYCNCQKTPYIREVIVVCCYHGDSNHDYTLSNDHVHLSCHTKLKEMAKCHVNSDQ